MAAIHAKNTLHAIWRQNIVNNLKWVEQEKLQSQQPTYKKNINNKILLSFLLFLSLLYIFTNNDIAYKFVYKHIITPVADTDEQTLCLKQHERTIVASNVGTSATTRNITMDQKHIHEVDGSYTLLKEVMGHIHDDKPEEVVQMRKKGFPSFLKLEDQKPNMLPVTPPRILHMPILGFRYNNNSATLKYFKTEKTGVVIRDIVPGGEFDRCGVKCMDFFQSIQIGNTSYNLDNFGKCWYPKLNVSLPVKDIIHRQPFGDGNFFIFDPGGDTNNIYILLFFHLLQKTPKT